MVPNLIFLLLQIPEGVTGCHLQPLHIIGCQLVRSLNAGTPGVMAVPRVTHVAATLPPMARSTSSMSVRALANSAASPLMVQIASLAARSSFRTAMNWSLPWLSWADASTSAEVAPLMRHWSWRRF